MADSSGWISKRKKVWKKHCGTDMPGRSASDEPAQETAVHVSDHCCLFVSIRQHVLVDGLSESQPDIQGQSSSPEIR